MLPYWSMPALTLGHGSGHAMAHLTHILILLTAVGCKGARTQPLSGGESAVQPSPFSGVSAILAGAAVADPQERARSALGLPAE